MDPVAAPRVLRERLGVEATSRLVELLDTVKEDCVNQVLTQSVERFERRLTEEVSKLRIEMVQGDAALRQEIGELRLEMREGMSALDGGLRKEISDLRHDLRQEMANQRFDLLKWSFIFWIGQVVAITGVMAALLRGISR